MNTFARLIEQLWTSESEAAIQDLLQELKYRMPNEVYLYADKLEQGDLIKYRQRLKVNLLKTGSPARSRKRNSFR